MFTCVSHQPEPKLSINFPATRKSYTKMSVSLDTTDRKIVTILQERGRISNSDLAKEIGLTTTPTLERVKRLERNGVIEGYTARVNREALDRGMTVFSSIKLVVHHLDEMEEFTGRIAEIPEILSCYNITGEYDYLLQIVVRDMNHYEMLLRKQLAQLPGVDRIYTSIVMSVIKEGTPVEFGPEDEGNEGEAGE